MSTVRILHLVPELLHQNGEIGNLVVLAKRLAVYGFETEILEYTAEKSVSFDDIDCVFIGSGPTVAMNQAHKPVQKVAPALRTLAESGVPFLAIAAGFSLLGRTITTETGEIQHGAGVFDVQTTLGGERVVGDFIVESTIGQLVGFENRNATIEIGQGISLGSVTYGRGNLVDVSNGLRHEGVLNGRLLGTYMHGPILANNPALADWFIDEILQRTGRTRAADVDGALGTLDGYAAQARAVVVAHPLSE